MPGTLVRDLRANLSLGMSDEEFQRGMAGLKAKAPAQGEQVAGAFAKGFSRQLGQAFRSLPQAQISADTSEADLKVNVLRQSLRDLANKRINVDLDAATALAEMRAIKGELEGLKDTATIDVKADIAKSLAALEVVERQVEKLDGKSVDVDIDVKGATAAIAEVGLLESALSALRLSGPLGPAAVGGAIALLPAAAAAAGSAVTFTLGSALAGIGLAASQGSATAQAAIARLKTAAQTAAAEIGRPFEAVWVTIVDTAQRELDQIGPTIRDSLADLAPTVQDFVSDAGSSLEELTPAVGAVERAFKVMLESLGPALPDIMHNLADGITAIADAVARNPETLTRMAQSLAAFAEWAGKATGKLIDFAQTLQDHAQVVQTFFGFLSLPTQALKDLGLGMVDVGQSADEMTQATLKSADGAGVLDQRLAGLINTFGLVGSQGADSAQQLMASWSQTFQSMTSVSSVMQQVQARTQASIAAQERQAAAQQQLADAQAAAVERISQAKRRLADTEERAGEQIQQADRRVVDTKQRAAEQIAAANERAAASRQAVVDAENQAAQRIVDAEERVEDARRRAADVAESSGARVADAAQRIEDAEQAAADHQVDAERRVVDAHERTQAALEDLTEARRRAKDEMEDLARSEAASVADIEGAEIALERARERRDQTNADPTSSALDKHEADFAFRQAEARLEDVKRRSAELQAQVTAAAQAGVEGSTQVMQASARVADAQEAERAASEALARQRVEDARTVASAVQALADVQRDAARQQEDAQRALATAEAEVDRARISGAQDVAAAKKAQADAEAAAAKTSVDAARQVRDAQADAAKAHKDAARDIQDAEAAVTKARTDSAEAIGRASQAVQNAMAGVGTSAHVTTEQFLAELERQVKNTEDWADNLVKLSGRVPAEMVEKLRALGPGAADVVAMAAEMTDPQLKHFVDLMGRSGKDSGDLFSKKLADSINANPQNVKVGLDDYRARVAFNQLIHDIGGAANVAISVTVGAALQATGHSADGNIFMANGGVLSFARGTERHVAQLAMPGTRVWAEPETGGEAYIPLAPTKRSRSEEILSQVADRFGGAFVKHQPAGSMRVAGGDGASAGRGGGVSIGPITLNFADDRDMYAKGQEAAAGLREYLRHGGVLPS